jgi:glycosyltransferase involved in cell wall biosynthesis
MKINIIGAAYPFRGGNAHYTSALYLALKKKHDVRLYTYRRQYPQFLYPGTTDKDPSQAPLKIEEAVPIIDYANPISWYRTSRMIRQDPPDLLIFNWFTPFTALQYWVISALVKKYTRARILFICHNVVPHEPTAFDRMFTLPVLKKGDFFLVHSGEDANALKELLPEANVKKAYHPVYDIFPDPGIPANEAKNKLGAGKKTLLFFGLVRTYKGLEYLIRALPLLQEHGEIDLLVVGEFWDNKKKYESLISDLGIGAHVKIIDRYVPNEEVGLYFRAADLVILPYVSATGSGILQIANHFEVPCVASRVGCFPEMIDPGKTGYLVDPADPWAIAAAVTEYFGDPANEKAFRENIAAKKKEFSWDKLIETIESFLDRPS